VIPDIEIGLPVVDDAERHVVTRLPHPRVRPRQFQPAFTTTVGGIGGVFPAPGNVVLEVTSLGNVYNECARESPQMLGSKCEWFTKALCRNTETGSITEEQPHIARVHGAVAHIFGMGAVSWRSAIHVVPAEIFLARIVLVPQVPRVQVVCEIALLVSYEHETEVSHVFSAARALRGLQIKRTVQDPRQLDEYHRKR
jgi:hypothetical protein